MERCIDKIPLKSFHPMDFVIVSICFIAELALMVSTLTVQIIESRNFNCDVGEQVAEKESFVQGECLKRYNQSYSPFLSLFLFILVTFSSVILVCIVYGCFVLSRVEEIERISNFNAEDPRQSPIVRTRRVSVCHFLHLFTRFVPALLSAVLQHKVLYPGNFPTKFLCDWPQLPSRSMADNANTTYYVLSNHTSVVCNNLVASWVNGFAIGFSCVNIGFAVVTFLEGIYLLRKVWQTKPIWDFLYDSNFCRYLLRKPNTPTGLQEYQERHMEEIARNTETVQPLLPPSIGEDVPMTFSIDDIYVPLVIRTGRAEAKHEFEYLNRGNVDEYQKFPDESIPIENLEDLFLPNKDTNNIDPRTILVVGRPGIGKSLLCNKILHDWSKGCILHNISKAFKYVFLFQFRWFNSEETRNTSLSQLLCKETQSHAPPDLFGYLLNNPKEILLIFDGLDELNISGCDEQNAGNGATDVMAISSLFQKLVRGKLLQGATVLTTTRVTGVGSFPGLSFDRKVEIAGFTAESVQDYVKKVYKQLTNTSDKILNHIKGSIDLQNLCYIPANCAIVCFILEMFIKLEKSSSESSSLPTTLTELYKYVLRIFIFKHNPEYQSKNIKIDWIYSDKYFSDSVKGTLDRIQQLALKGMEEKQLLFYLDDAPEIENCGLLHKIPVHYKTKYYFLHLSMQEFLAARAIVTSGKEDSFISSKALDKNFYLVIQFVAGLLKNYHERQKHFVKRYYQTLFSSISKNKIRLNEIPVRMMKCLYELGNDTNFRDLQVLASNLDIYRIFTFSSWNFPTPSDWSAILYFLKQYQPLRGLCIAESSFLNYLELGNLLKDKSPKSLALRAIELDDQNLQTLLKPMLENKCKLTQSDIANNSTARGKVETQQQCRLTHEYYNLTTLDIPNNNITAKGVSYLSDILTSECFKINKLNLAHNKINDDGVVQLLESITHGNCKLTDLDISQNNITDKLSPHLQKALTHKHCELTILDVEGNNVASLAVSLSDALTDGNCKLTVLNISSNNISDEGACALGDALTDENCKLAELDISSNNISDEGACALGDALTDENCKLTYLNISSNNISDEGARVLGAALRHENCKLKEFNVKHNNISSEGVCALADAQTHKKLNVFTI